jgi:hypothetical protein
MAEQFKRDDLIVNALYYDEKKQSYFFTPDGIGCYWLTAEEAVEEFPGIDEAIFIYDLED